MILSKLKRAVARIIINESIGSFISVIKSNKIKQFNCVYDIAFPTINKKIMASLFWGLYEKAEASFVTKYLSDDYPVIELGGSLGIVSCIIGKKIRPNKLIIVEANSALLPIIEKNLMLNQVGNYSLEYGGIGLAEQLYFVEGETTEVGRVGGHFEPDSILINRVDINNLLLKNEIDLFSLVCDIEGAENCLLFESPSCLAKCNEMIIELHEVFFDGRYLSFSDQLSQIEKLNFRIIDRHGPVVYAKKGAEVNQRSTVFDHAG